MKRLTEKYRPKTKSELIGNEKAIQQLEEVIKAEGRALLYGEPGVGKTSSVYALANDLGYSVYEVNASDSRRKEELEELLTLTRMKGLRKHLYLIDEVDGLKNWSMMANILVEATHPVILVANERYKVGKKVRDLCREIRYYRPRVQQVVTRVKEIAKKEGVEPDFSGVSEDVRASINAVFHGGERRESENQFNLVDRILRGKGGGEDLDEDDLIWLLDNLHRYYTGRNLFDAATILSVAASTGRTELLDELPKGSGKPKYPYYFRRIRTQKRKEK